MLTKSYRSLKRLLVVGLMLVFIIVGVLFALLLPAFQAAFEASRRSPEPNSLKQLLLAEHGKELPRVKLSFPNPADKPVGTPDIRRGLEAK